MHEIGNLTIAKRIAELHHGEIDAEGAPNAGRTFHVTLPLSG